MLVKFLLGVISSAVVPVGLGTTKPKFHLLHHVTTLHACSACRVVLCRDATCGSWT